MDKGLKGLASFFSGGSKQKEKTRERDPDAVHVPLRHRQLSHKASSGTLESEEEKAQSLDSRIAEMCKAQGMAPEAAARVMDLSPALKYTLLQGYEQLQAKGTLPARRKSVAASSETPTETPQSSRSRRRSRRKSSLSEASGEAPRSLRASAVRSRSSIVQSPEPSPIAKAASKKASFRAEAEEPAAAADYSENYSADGAAGATATDVVVDVGDADDGGAPAAGAPSPNAAVVEEAPATPTQPPEPEPEPEPEPVEEEPIMSAPEMVALLSAGDPNDNVLIDLDALSDDADWTVHFLLIGGLDALSKPLERLALLTSPSEAEQTLMAAILQRLRFLITEEHLGVIAAVGNPSDLAELCRACGVEEPATRGEKGAVIHALALCVDPKGAVDGQLDFVIPLLVSAAEDSAASHTALIEAFERAAKTRGLGYGRFASLVQCCAPPSGGGQLVKAGRALCLLNALISSPAKLSARMALRDECAQLGLLKHVEALKESAADEEQYPVLAAHHKLFVDEQKADDRELYISQNPLEEFAKECVVLFTSISGGESKIHDDDWNKLEVLFKQKKVGFHGVDGSLPERKAAREALWGVSGEKKYPQVFVDKKCESCCCCVSPPAIAAC